MEVFLGLAEHLPLEQGLRRTAHRLGGNTCTLAEHLPLEQGLRPMRDTIIGISLLTRRASSIRTRIKTHSHCKSIILSNVLAEHLPLEQGLRHLEQSIQEG